MSNTLFEIFLKRLSVFPVMGNDLKKTDYTAIDLSVNNELLRSVNIASSKALEAYVWQHIKATKSKIAYGGYLENRSLYQRSTFFNQQNKDTERNIHIGLDLWVEAGTPIFSPLDGEIYSLQNNTNFGDYGPTIILKHNIENQEFYTLYGHLSLESILDKFEGQKITKGQHIATLGTSEINGDYPPHLHFQIIKNIQNQKGDYPGVCNTTDIEFYKLNCPNPNILLRLL